jgi:hypothetical protein
VISLGLLRGQAWAQDTEVPINLVEKNTPSRPLDAQFLALASISYASAIYDGRIASQGRSLAASRRFTPSQWA